jgi:hypothetical protein
MAISDQTIDQAFEDLKKTCGGVRNDYFGLLYLEREFGIDRDVAITQVAFGGNDYGFDGFHFDEDKRNLYLYQFKCSDSFAQFKPSFHRLIDDGMERIFGATYQDQGMNPLLQQIKSCLLENEAVIDRVLVHFVFNGDPAEAERSAVLDKLREDLENKKYLIDQRFGRPVTLVVEFRSARSRRVGSSSHVRKTRTYPIHFEEALTRTGPDGEILTVGFLRLMDLHRVYEDMGQRLFDRNIRAALADSETVNRSLDKAFRRIVIDHSEPASAFAFDHNGVTLSAEALHGENGIFRITEPRLLNGAQTVATLSRFLKGNAGNQKLVDGKADLDGLYVLAKVVTNAAPAFVTAVTVNNNRQNPVEPWNLRANDDIQVELQDKFAGELGIFYARQENSFENLSDEDLEDRGITEYKAVELKRLAQTFLVSDGDIDKFLRFREVFEDDRIYNQVFSESRLKADARQIILCYKVQFRLRRLLRDILEKGANKYEYMSRARSLLWALLCQGMLNDSKLEARAEEFGKSLSTEAQFTDWASTLATTRCRFIIGEVVQDKLYADKAADGNFSFLRTNAVYKRCMQIAYKRWKWVERRLK